MLRPKRQETPEEAKARVAIRERILREAIKVLGDGEEFRPTSTPFLTKLHSGSSSSDESRNLIPELKESAPKKQDKNESAKRSPSQSSSTSYSYSDILQSQTDHSASIRIRNPLLSTAQKDIKPPLLIQNQTKSTHDQSPITSAKLQQQVSLASEISPSDRFLTDSSARVLSENTLTKVKENGSRSHVSEMSALSSIHTSGNDKSEASPSKLDTIRTEESFPASSWKPVSYSTSSRHGRKGKAPPVKTKAQTTIPEGKQPISGAPASRGRKVSTSISLPASAKSETTYSKFLSEEASSKSLKVKTSLHVSESDDRASRGDSEHLKSSNSRLKSVNTKISSNGSTFQNKSSANQSVEESNSRRESVKSRQKTSSSASSSGESSMEDQRMERSYQSPPLPRLLSKNRPAGGPARSSQENEKRSGRASPRSPSLAYTDDEFLPTESGHIKTKDEKLERSVRTSNLQSKHKRRYDRPKSDRSEGLRQQKTLNPHHHATTHLFSHHRMIRPYLSLPSPVADLVSHCVEANEQIYRHALQLAEQMAKSYKKKRLKTGARAPAQAAAIDKEKPTPTVSQQCNVDFGLPQVSTI